MVDWNKPIQTKGGEKARLLGTTNDPVYPRVVAVMCQTSGREAVYHYTEDGRIIPGRTDYNDNIINSRIEHTLWINVYENYCGTHPTRQQAEIAADPATIRGRVRVVVAEGVWDQ